MDATVSLQEGGTQTFSTAIEWFFTLAPAWSNMRISLILDPDLTVILFTNNQGFNPLPDDN
jgi:hypothetical protein